MPLFEPPKSTPIVIFISFSGFSRRWDWQTSQRWYGGSLRNTGPHPLEQALDILKALMPNASFEILPLSPAFITQGGPGCVAVQVVEEYQD